MSSSIKHCHRGSKQRRGGFTLTELLIGITIIGLLVGMLAVAGGGVIGTAREFAVTNEITQMSQAIESFKTKYGFYPPSFEQFKRTVNTGSNPDVATLLQPEANQLLPYLNKISPNHNELELVPGGGGRRRLDAWWERVGCNMNQTTSLQFWLSGLCHNKQYPLTGGLPMTGPFIPKAYNVNELDNGTPAMIQREVFYDFDVERFVPIQIANESGGGGDATTLPVAQYIMDHGKTNGFLFFVYRDSGSYLPVAQPDAIPVDSNANTNNMTWYTPAPGYADPSYVAYLNSPNHRGLAYHFLETAGSLEPTFANPNTFQLIAFGLDGDAGVQNPDDGSIIDNRNRGNLNAQLPKSADNLCNFANGRLDKYINEQQ